MSNVDEMTQDVYSGAAGGVPTSAVRTTEASATQVQETLQRVASTTKVLAVPAFRPAFVAKAL